MIDKLEKWLQAVHGFFTTRRMIGLFLMGAVAWGYLLGWYKEEWRWVHDFMAGAFGFVFFVTIGSIAFGDKK